MFHLLIVRFKYLFTSRNGIVWHLMMSHSDPIHSVVATHSSTGLVKGHLYKQIYWLYTSCTLAIKLFNSGINFVLAAIATTTLQASFLLNASPPVLHTQFLKYSFYLYYLPIQPYIRLLWLKLGTYFVIQVTSIDYTNDKDHKSELRSN